MDARRARPHESDLFFFASPDLLCIVDFDGRFVQVNPAWENVLGFSSAELCARPYIEFVHPDDREHTAAAAEQLIRDSATHTFENRYQLKDGSYKWLQWTCASLPERRRIFGTARDATGLRQLREDLSVANETLEQRVRERKQARHTNDVLKSLIDACPHAIVAVDSQRNVRIWNAAASKIFGWTAAEVLGGRVPFVSDQKREDSKRFNERALRGESITNYATQRSRRDGSQVDLLVSAAPTRDIDGNIDGFLTVATDITDRNKLELQLLRVQRLESLGTLASGIAHDLNNVLAPIGMALQLFRMRFPDASTRNTLDVLDSCVDRGAGLIRQILTFARGVQNEHFPVQTTPLLLDAERVLMQTFPKSITIRSDLPQDLWMVSADSTQLHQVLMNLCINARDAMQEGGTLTITARNAVLDETYVRMNPERSPGSYVVIEVQDTGHGMPADIQEKIFEPFFTTKELGQGTGLGLSTAAAIVRNHGGFIDLHSAVDGGTSFKIYFPALPGQEKQGGAAAKAAVPIGSGELILIVEDEPAVRDIGKLVLEAHGYRVIHAKDGAEGVTMFAQHADEIRLVISDMDMPVMNGAGMIRSLERINPNVRVISASGLASSGGTSRNSSGASRYRAVLPKPYTAGELLRTVADIINAA